MSEPAAQEAVSDTALGPPIRALGPRSGETKTGACSMAAAPISPTCRCRACSCAAPIAHGRIRVDRGATPSSWAACSSQSDMNFREADRGGRGHPAASKSSDYHALGLGQGPLCRRYDCHVHRADARGGRGHRSTSCVCRFRGIAGGLGYRRGASTPMRPRVHEALVRQRILRRESHRDRRSRRGAGTCPPSPLRAGSSEWDAMRACRSNAAACWPTGTTGTTSLSSTSRPRAACEADRAGAGARPARRTRCASSRPTSAAASAARTASCRRTSRSPRWRMKVGHPVRWIEDRREHLLASVHARDHFYDLTISAGEPDGTLLGVEGDIYIDAGAYALWPTGSFMEASMASRNLTGPYRIRHLNLKTYTVATNKAPMGPYRGVGAAGRLLCDRAAGRRGGARARPRAVRPAPAEHRHRRRAAVPHRGRHAARHRRLRRRARHRARHGRSAGIRASARPRGEPDGRAIGVALRSTPSRAATAPWNGSSASSRVVPGYESANARMLPDGSVIIHVGAQNHGQGHETTLAQIAAHELTIDPVAISIRYGDTATVAVRVRHVRLALDRVRRRRGGARRAGC